MNAPRSGYELIIRPSRGWFDFDFANIWRYRDLLLLLVHRDFVAKYKQTILGPLWFVLQPLLTTVVFAIVFAGAIKISTDGVPPILFYFCGLLCWNYFAQTFQHTSSALINNSAIFGKVYFPRLIVPMSSAVSNLLSFGLQLATMLVLWLYFKFFSGTDASFALSTAIVWFPMLVLQVVALSFGTGLWLSAMTVRYRDFVLLSSFLVQIWMYATPVIYPLSQVPEHWRWLSVLNPMTMPVEATKYMFLGQGTVTTVDFSISITLTAILLVSGVIVFNKVEKTFVDTV